MASSLFAGFENFPWYRQQEWNSQSSDDIPYLGLTVVFGVLVFLFESYIDMRQLSNFKTIKTLPRELTGTIPDDVFQKSSLYGADKLSFSRFETCCSFIFSLYLLLAGWFPYAWDLSINSRNHLITTPLSPLMSEIVTTLLFVFLTSAVDTIFSLPFSLYSTFVVEEKHGFNKTVFYFLLSIPTLSDSWPLFPG
jgi:STE24 endopeptidase